jgi:hypothetical protein
MISYYRRFIPNCSRIASTLYKLLKKDAKFVWTEAQEILTPKHKAPMEIRKTAKHPFEKCYLDNVVPLPVTQGNNKYILTFQDDLSNYAVDVPIGQ